SQGMVGVLAGVPFFAQAHGSDLHANLQNPAYRGITRSVLRQATKVFYVTPNLRAYLDAFQYKLVWLPNPVDVGPERQPPTQARKVLIFTRLHPIKGVELIFPAVTALRAIGIELTVPAYGPLAAELRGRYGGDVRFVEPIPHERITEFLAGFDMVIGQ